MHDKVNTEVQAVDSTLTDRLSVDSDCYWALIWFNPIQFNSIQFDSIRFDSRNCIELHCICIVAIRYSISYHNISIMSAMNFSTSKQYVKPPQRGVFPLDHDDECKPFIKASIRICIIFRLFIRILFTAPRLRYLVWHDVT